MQSPSSPSAKFSEPMLLHWLHKVGDETGSSYLQSVSSSPANPLERQFANGFLLGHLLAALSSPLHIALREGFLSELRNVNTTTGKIANFQTLSSVLKTIGLPLQNREVDAICTEEKGAVQKVLFALQDRYDAAKDAGAFDKTTSSAFAFAAASSSSLSPSSRAGGRTAERVSPSQRNKRKLSAEHAAAAAEYRARKENSSRQPLSFLQQLLASGLTPKQAAQEAVLERFDRVKREREARISEEERLKEERKRAEIRGRVMAFKLARQAREHNDTAALLSHNTQITRLQNSLQRRDVSLEITLAQRTAALDILTRNAAGHELKTGVAEFELLMRRQGLDPYGSSSGGGGGAAAAADSDGGARAGNAAAAAGGGQNSASGGSGADEGWPGAQASGTGTLRSFGHSNNSNNASAPLGSTMRTAAVPPPAAVSTAERTLRRIVPNKDEVDVLLLGGGDSSGSGSGSGGDETSLGFFRRLASTVGNTYSTAEGDAYASALGPRVREQRSNRRDVETRARLDATAQQDSRAQAEAQAAEEARLQALLSHAEKERQRAAELHERRRLKAEREAEIVASMDDDDERRSEAVRATMDEDRKRLTAERDLQRQQDEQEREQEEQNEEDVLTSSRGSERVVDADPKPAYHVDAGLVAALGQQQGDGDDGRGRLEPWGKRFSPEEVYRSHLKHAPSQPGGPNSSASTNVGNAAAAGQLGLPVAADEDDEGERLLDAMDCREFERGQGQWRLPAAVVSSIGDVEAAVVAQATAVSKGLVGASETEGGGEGEGSSSSSSSSSSSYSPVPSPTSPRASSSSLSSTGSGSGSPFFPSSPVPSHGLGAGAAVISAPANLPASCRLPGLPDPEAAEASLKAILRQVNALNNGNGNGSKTRGPANNNKSKAEEKEKQKEEEEEEEHWVSAILHELPSFFRGPQVKLADPQRRLAPRKSKAIAGALSSQLFAAAAPPLPPSISTPLVEAARNALLSRVCSRVQGLVRLSPAAIVTAAIACFDLNLNLLAKTSHGLKKSGFAPAVDPLPSPSPAKPEGEGKEGDEEEAAPALFPSLFSLFPALRQAAEDHHQLLEALGLADSSSSSSSSSGHLPGLLLPELATLATRHGFLQPSGGASPLASPSSSSSRFPSADESEGSSALFELGAFAAGQLLLLHRAVVEPHSSLLSLAAVKERIMTPEERAAAEAEAAMAAAGGAPPAAGGKAPAPNSKEAKAAAEAAAAAAAAKEAADAAAMASCLPLKLQGQIDAGCDNETIANQLWSHAEKSKVEAGFVTGVNAFRDAVRDALLKKNQEAAGAAEGAAADEAVLVAQLTAAINTARSAASGVSTASATSSGTTTTTTTTSAAPAPASAAPASAAAAKGGKAGAKDSAAAPVEAVPAAPALAGNIPPAASIPGGGGEVSWASLYLTAPASMEVCLPDASAAFLNNATSSIADRLSQGSLFAMALGAVLGRLAATTTTSTSTSTGVSGVLLDSIPSNGRQLLAVEHGLRGRLLWEVPAPPAASAAAASVTAADAANNNPALSTSTVPRLDLSSASASSSSSPFPSGGSSLFVPSPHAPKGWDGKLSSLLAAYVSGVWALPRLGPQAILEWRRLVHRYEDAVAAAAANALPTPTTPAGGASSAASRGGAGADSGNSASSQSLPAAAAAVAPAVPMPLQPPSSCAISLHLDFGARFAKSILPSPSASGAASGAVSGAASPAASAPGGDGATPAQGRSRSGSNVSDKGSSNASADSSSSGSGVSPVPGAATALSSSSSPEWLIDLLTGAVVHNSSDSGSGEKAKPLSEALLGSAAAAMLQIKKKAAAEGGADAATTSPAAAAPSTNSASSSALSLSGLSLLTDAVGVKAFAACSSLSLLRSLPSNSKSKGKAGSHVCSPGLAGGLLANWAPSSTGSDAAAAAAPVDSKSAAKGGKADPKAAAAAAPAQPAASSAPPPGSTPEEAAAAVSAWLVSAVGVGSVIVGGLDIAADKADAMNAEAGKTASSEAGDVPPLRQLLLTCASLEVFIEKAAEERQKGALAAAKTQLLKAKAAAAAEEAALLAAATASAAIESKEAEGGDQQQLPQQQEAFLGLAGGESQEDVDAAAFGASNNEEEDEAAMLEEAAAEDDGDDLAFLLSSSSAASSVFVDKVRHAFARGLLFDGAHDLSALLAVYSGCKESRSAISGLAMRALRTTQARVRARCRAFARGLFRILHESSPSRKAALGDSDVNNPWKLLKGHTLEGVLGAAVQSADAESMKQQRAAARGGVVHGHGHGHGHSGSGAGAHPLATSLRGSPAASPSKGPAGGRGATLSSPFGSPSSTLKSAGGTTLTSPYGGKGGFSATSATGGGAATTALAPFSPGGGHINSSSGGNGAAGSGPSLILTPDGIVSPLLAGIYAKLYRTAQDPAQPFTDEDAMVLRTKVTDVGAQVWSQAEVVRAAAREYLSDGYFLEKDWADALASYSLTALGKVLVVAAMKGLKDDAAFLLSAEKAVAGRLHAWYCSQVYAGPHAATFQPNYTSQYYQQHSHNHHPHHQHQLQGRSSFSAVSAASSSSSLLSHAASASNVIGMPPSSSSPRQHRNTLHHAAHAPAIPWPASSAGQADARHSAAVRGILAGELRNALSLATESAVSTCDALSSSSAFPGGAEGKEADEMNTLRLTEGVFFHAVGSLGEYCDSVGGNTGGPSSSSSPSSQPSLAASLFLLHGSLSVVKKAASATLVLQGLEGWIGDSLESTVEVCRGLLRSWLAARDAAVFAATKRLTEAVDTLARSRFAALISASVSDSASSPSPSTLYNKPSANASTAASRAIMLGKSPLVAPVLGLQPSDFAVSVSDSQTVLYCHFGPLAAPEDPEPAANASKGSELMASNMASSAASISEDPKSCVAACLASLSFAAAASPFAADALPLLPPQPGISGSQGGASSSSSLAASSGGGGLVKTSSSFSLSVSSPLRGGGGPSSSPSAGSSSSSAGGSGNTHTSNGSWERANAFETAIRSGEWTPAHARISVAGIAALRAAFSEIFGQGGHGSSSARGNNSGNNNGGNSSRGNTAEGGRRPSFAGLLSNAGATAASGPAGLAAMMLASPSSSDGFAGDETAASLDGCVAQLKEALSRAAANAAAAASSSSSSSSTAGGPPIGSGWLAASTAMLRPLVRAYAYSQQKSSSSSSSADSNTQRPPSTGTGRASTPTNTGGSRPSSRANAPATSSGGSSNSGQPFAWTASNRRRFLVALLLARLRRAPSLAQLVVCLHHAFEKDVDEDGCLSRQEWEGVRMPFELCHSYACDVIGSFSKAWKEYEQDKLKRTGATAAASAGSSGNGGTSAKAAAEAAASAAMALATGQAATAPSMSRMLTSRVDTLTTADTHLRETLTVAGTGARSAEASAIKGLLFSLFATTTTVKGPDGRHEQQTKIDFVSALLHLCVDPRSPLALFGGSGASSTGHHHHHHQHYSSPYRRQHEHQLAHEATNGSNEAGSFALSMHQPPSPSSAAHMSAIPSMVEAVKADPLARAVIMTATASAMATGGAHGSGAGSSGGQGGGGGGGAGASGELPTVCVAGAHPPIPSSSSSSSGSSAAGAAGAQSSSSGGSPSSSSSALHAGGSILVAAQSTAQALATVLSLQNPTSAAAGGVAGLRSVGVLKAACLAQVHSFLVAARDAEKIAAAAKKAQAGPGAGRAEKRKRETPVSERLAQAAPAVAAFYEHTSLATPFDAKLSLAALQLLYRTFVGGLVGIKQQEADGGESGASGNQYKNNAADAVATLGQLLAASSSADDGSSSSPAPPSLGFSLATLMAALHSYLVLPCSPLLLARQASPEVLLRSSAASPISPPSSPHHQRQGSGGGGASGQQYTITGGGGSARAQ